MEFNYLKNQIEYLVLSSYIPDSEAYIFVFHSFHIETCS